MIIKKIEIENFRSYYKQNVFELCPGLNLIIGSNGDGKTTFYDALDWLFRTDGTNKMDEKYISKKRCKDLFENESDDVRVAVTYEHNGLMKTLEKMFHFTKSFDGSITMSNFSFNLIEQNGVERIEHIGNRFDFDLPSEIRKYVMFKGEGDLDIFQKSNSLKLLIETFSDVKDFESYFKFMEFAKMKAGQARDNAQKSDRKNSEKIAALKRTIDQETSLISRLESEIKTKESESINFEKLLRNLEQSQEASKLLISVNSRIDNLDKKRRETAARIKEDYTFNLLDDLWVLMGFDPVSSEFSTIVSEVDRKRRKLEHDYILKTGADRVIKTIQKPGFIPLPVHIPGRKFMEEMLKEEVCKICGRPAEKDGAAWKFMFARLEEYKDSLKTEEIEDIEPFYKNNYIVELQKLDTILNDNINDVIKLRSTINERIALNNRLHEDVKKIESNLESELEQKKRILAQTDGITEEQLTSNYENISKWMAEKQKADNRVSFLRNEIETHQKKLDDAQSELDSLAKGTTAARFALAAQMLRHISDAFFSAKESNKKRLLHTIEDEANNFLELLNKDDFKGSIRILERANGQGEVVLMSNDNSQIFNANTALRTTYLMSVLFAISKISSIRKENASYPLLFDAPTSSFTESKESEFFKVIARLDKQIIVVTKSFLKEDSTGNLVLDRSKVNDLNGRVFRIEKKRPFDDKNLSTIQTIISQIKE